MIRLLISGGLGNQLIQYAAVRAQAKRIGVELALDPQFQQEGEPRDACSFWLQTLPIRAQIIKYPKSGPLSGHSLLRRGYRKLVRPMFWSKYAQPAWTEDPNFFDISARTVVYGYFQSLFYLMPRDEEILSEISLSFVAPPEAVAFARSVAAGNYVSMHVRRGDYLDDAAYSHLDYSSYAVAAMDLIRKRLGRVTFLVFSDDIDWCKKQSVFTRDCEFIEPNQFGANPAIDQFFMSVCSHHIISNSSYSWWAAWASFDKDKICILPKKWVLGHQTKDLGLVHPNWVTL